MDEARYIREKNTVDAKAFNTLVYRTLEKELRELRRCILGLGQGGVDWDMGRGEQGGPSAILRATILYMLCEICMSAFLCPLFFCSLNGRVCLRVCQPRGGTPVCAGPGGGPAVHAA
jgi:hypothetical protein